MAKSGKAAGCRPANRGFKSLPQLISEFFMCSLGAGVPEWSKGLGLGPSGIGLRGFKPRPPQPLKRRCHFHSESPSAISPPKGRQRELTRISSQRHCLRCHRLQPLRKVDQRCDFVEIAHKSVSDTSTVNLQVPLVLLRDANDN